MLSVCLVERLCVESYQGRVYDALVEVDLEPSVQEDSGGSTG